MRRGVIIYATDTHACRYYVDAADKKGSRCSEAEDFIIGRVDCCYICSGIDSDAALGVVDVNVCERELNRMGYLHHAASEIY